ncbi:MAG: hypothetical protein JW861_05620 [Bacteroidales bacterium]|nr:hypothetical protein [Bacteroidales bacterium]
MLSVLAMPPVNGADIPLSDREGGYPNDVERLYILGEESLLNVLIPNEQWDSNYYKPGLHDAPPVIYQLNEVVVDEGLPESTLSCIRNCVQYPAVAYENRIEGVVSLLLEFDKDGNAMVRESYSNHPMLEEYVTSNLDHMKLRNCFVWTGRTYHAMFIFRIR